MRIVAGAAKGRKIEAPKGMDVRPTTDRVREALFSAIAFRIHNNRVLDLFAGTGALGLEALSRGAATAVFADRSRQSIEIIRRNIALCGFQARSTVWERDAATTVNRLKAEGRQFDLVFLDPPYESVLLEQSLVALDEAALVAEDGLILAEHPANRPPRLPPGLSIASTKRYGKTLLSFVKRALDLEPAEHHEEVP